MEGNLKDNLMDNIATEAEGDEIGEEIVLERDPVTGEWREIQAEGRE